MLSLDHIVIGAADLERGTTWMTDALGVAPAGGGRHADFGTHNKLWRIGHAYLEVIAIDPDAATPPRPRWFGLDTPATRERLMDGPALLTWVVATDDLAAVTAQAPRDPGPVRRMSRDNLFWDLTVPSDGATIWNGVFPTLIRWPEGVASPARTLPAQGVEIDSFGYAGPAAIAADLDALGAAALITRLGDSPTPQLALKLQRGPTLVTITS